MTFFTICSNNYLGQAIVLGNSLQTFHPDDDFLIVLMDERSNTIDYSKFNHRIVTAEEIEPDIESLARRYDIVELNTCIKPRVFEWLFESNSIDRAIYLDPDIRAFSYFQEVVTGLETNNVLLTPHIFSPIPRDGKSPDEALFLNYGIYNLGFVALKKSDTTLKLIQWWKSWTFELGYNEVAHGIFVDQLPMNYAPLFFEGVKIISSLGYNMAPWNLHERLLERKDGEFYVNGKDKLAFYHFSSFRMNIEDLPVHNYTRYALSDRPDMREITVLYNNELTDAGFLKYKETPCHYVVLRKQHLAGNREAVIQRKPIYKRILLQLFRMPLARKVAAAIYINNRSYDAYYEQRL